VIGQDDAIHLQKRSLARFLRLMVGAAPDSRLFERRGVAAAVVPSIPLRSVVNSVTYESAAQLADALDDLADAYAKAGVQAWTVWVPEGDEEAEAALADAGHVLDARPAAMSLELEGFEPPDLGDLDWDDQATAAELVEINGPSYGWGAGEVAPGFRDLRPGPSTHLYRARVDGTTAAVGLIADTDDEASVFLVSTDAAHRGKGIASRLMGAALAAARDRGKRTSTLQATAAGEPVYAALGYRSFGALHMWERREV
jgi:GNAT superfamily N-acetyltransferase